MESGIDKKSNILILTSFLSNDGSSKMVNDIVKSLENDFNVDVLTKYPLKGGDSVKVYSAYNKYEKYIHYSFLYLKNQILKYKEIFAKVKVNKKESLPYYFFGLNEEVPPVSSKKILKKIKKEYDFVLVFFWQGFLTSKTLKDISDKIGKPFLLVAADMFPMTGGCSYFWDCNRLVKSCGKCPGLDSNDENDVTRKNFLFKKIMFEKINCIFLGNSWQINHASKSGLFNQMGKIYPIVDENVFRPRDRKMLKKKFNYSDKIVLFFGSLGVHDPRKGFKYLLEALQLLAKAKPDIVENIVLVVAGSGEKVSDLDTYRVEYTGYLSFEKLAEYYAMADVFLSPSIQDAGPMMLNQALMCGTPAVAFDIGTACDIINDKTGYVAKYRDSKDFCKGIIELISKSKIELINIYQECRLQSLQRSSYEAFRNDVINAFDRIKK
ncbi:hypothetical protein OA88_03315 [Flavobacterium sp. JRM]|nr:hypothetical protein OA88_03315 [Flavobacterium sp. JRM]